MRMCGWFFGSEKCNVILGEVRLMRAAAGYSTVAAVAIERVHARVCLPHAVGLTL